MLVNIPLEHMAFVNLAGTYDLDGKHKQNSFRRPCLLMGLGGRDLRPSWDDPPGRGVL